MTKDVLAKVARCVVIAVAILCCIRAGVVILGQAIVVDRWAHDYSVYWRVANEPVELAFTTRNEKPFPYAPTMLLWIQPLALVPSIVGYWLIAALGLGGIVMACRRYLSPFAIGLVLISAPMLRCVRNGQISAILSAVLIWACGATNRIAAGVALGCIASIKPQLVLMAPLMLVLNRDWRAFWAAGATFVAILAATLLLYGIERWPEWIASMDYFHGVLMDNGVLNIAATPASVAENYGLPPLPFMLAGAVVGGVLVYLSRDLGPLEKASAIGAGSLLAAPYALSYDMIVLMPLLAMSVLRGNLFAAPSLAAMLNPLALIVSFFVLIRDKIKLPTGAKHATA